MKKYLAKLIFNVSIDQQNQDVEFDEQIRIIDAKNAEEAFYKARRIGKTEEGSFKSQNHNHISWQFIDVSELYAIESIKDGGQLYSTTHKMNDGQSYIQYIKQKSIEIQVKNLNFA